MDYRELLEKYNLLLSENSRLIKENDRLGVIIHGMHAIHEI